MKHQNSESNPNFKDNTVWKKRIAPTLDDPRLPMPAVSFFLRHHEIGHCETYVQHRTSRQHVLLLFLHKKTFVQEVRGPTLTPATIARTRCQCLPFPFHWRLKTNAYNAANSTSCPPSLSHAFSRPQRATLLFHDWNHCVHINGLTKNSWCTDITSESTGVSSPVELGQSSDQQQT